MQVIEKILTSNRLIQCQRYNDPPHELEMRLDPVHQGRGVSNNARVLRLMTYDLRVQQKMVELMCVHLRKLINATKSASPRRTEWPFIRALLPRTVLSQPRIMWLSRWCFTFDTAVTNWHQLILITTKYDKVAGLFGLLGCSVAVLLLAVVVGLAGSLFGREKAVKHAVVWRFVCQNSSVANFLATIHIP